MKIGRLILALVIAIFSTSSYAFAESPIRIGSFLSTTGPVSSLGDPEMKVLEYYVDHLNKEGGIHGRKIELVLYDDSGAADKASIMVKRMIEKDNVDLIIGGSITSTTMAVIPQIERAEIPYISLAAAVAITEPTKKWVFKTNQSDQMVAEKVLGDMKKRGFTKVALVGEDNGFAKSGMSQSQIVAKNYGIDIVAVESFSGKDPDITPQLTRIKTSGAAQAIFVWAAGQAAVTASKNYKQLGLTIPLYQSHAVGNKDFLRMAGDSAEGTRLPGVAIILGDQLASTDPQRPVVTAFTKAYENSFKADASAPAGIAYDAFQIAVSAIHRAGSTDKARVREEIEKTSGFVGTIGTYSMSATDHMGLHLNSLQMVEIRNSAFIPIH